MLFCSVNLHAQKDKGRSLSKEKPTAETKNEENKTQIDSSVLTQVVMDTFPNGERNLDSLMANQTIAKGPDVEVSPDSIPAPITYGARDTMWFDKEKNEVHLFGQAFVKFEKYEIKAGYIIFDFENDITYAEGREGQNGETIEKPEFSDGNQIVNYNRLKYNFKTKKGLVYDAVTTEGDLFVLGATTKFISADADSLLTDDHIYQRDALVTSCNHPHPHYGIRTSKLKVIPDKIAVAGPSNLELAGVKTPIVLPFGFFPINSETASSGLIFPNDYEYSQQLGFGLREVGYYFPINDHLDLRLTGDIYTRGTFGLRLASNYKKRYAYSGNMRLGFSNRREENVENGVLESKKAYSVTLTHDQDSKAHPYRKIGGTINISTSDYRSDNFNDATSVLQSVYRSNFNFTHSMPRSSFRMSLGLSHDQNTQTGVVNMTLPDLKVNMNTIYPFKRKNQGGNQEKWYEKINVKYDGAAKAFVRTQDSILFTEDVLDDLQYGISHKGTASASFRAFKYFNVVPSVNYNEIWFFRTLEKSFNTNADPLLNPEAIRLDSTISEVVIMGETMDTIYQVDTTYLVQDNFVNNFDQYRNFSASVGLSTQLFNTFFRFKKGPIRGIRHVIKPNISFQFNPGTRERYELVIDDPNNLDQDLQYNPFSGGVFGTPSLVNDAMSINYSFINILEGKYFSKRDSVLKKFKFFENITVSGNYNFAADSLKWSPVRIRGNANLIKGLSSFQFNSTLDTYERNEDGGLIDQSIWSTSKRPFRFNNLMGSINTRLKFSQIRDLFKGKEVSEDDVPIIDESSTKLGSRFDENPGVSRFDPNFEEDFSGFEGEDPDAQSKLKTEDKKLPHILDLLDNFSLNHSFNFVLQKQINGVDTFYVNNNSLSITGSVELTDNWTLNFDRISYDFKNKALVYPSLNLVRDLHCWSMSFRWAPQRGVYSFFIGVKANTFDFMKYDYGQNRSDGLRSR